MESPSKNLLVSKHYKRGEHKLWRLDKNKIVEALGYSPPKGEMHGGLYEHTLTVGDIFVSIIKTGYLYEWEAEEPTLKNRPDARANFNGNTIYFEVENGNQKARIIEEKLHRYIRLFKENHELFGVIFVVPPHYFEKLKYLLVTFKAPNAYGVVMEPAFIADPLNAQIVSRTMSHTLSQLIPKA